MTTTATHLQILTQGTPVDSGGHPLFYADFNTYTKHKMPWTMLHSQTSVGYIVTALNASNQPVPNAVIRFDSNGSVGVKHLRYVTDSTGKVTLPMYYRYEGTGNFGIWLDKNDNGVRTSDEPYYRRYAVWVNYYNSMKATGTSAAAYNADMLRWTNDWRRAHGLVALTSNANGNAGAYVHAKKMASCGGCGFHAVAHNWAGNTSWGENVAGAQDLSVTNPQAEILEAFQASSLHNANLLHSDFRYYGIGISNTTTTRSICTIFSSGVFGTNNGSYGCKNGTYGYINVQSSEC